MKPQMKTKVMVLMHEPEGRFADYWQAVSVLRERDLMDQGNHQASYMGIDKDGSTWSVTIWDDRKRFEEHWERDVLPVAEECGLKPLPLLICPIVMELDKYGLVYPTRKKQWTTRMENIQRVIHKLKWLHAMKYKV